MVLLQNMGLGLGFGVVLHMSLEILGWGLRVGGKNV